MSQHTDPLPRSLTLRDGSEIVVRPIRPADKDAITSAFERLSAESRYRRFFAPLQRLSDRDLAYLTEVDHHDHDALIAFKASSGEPLGVARYIRSENLAEAEVAVTVVDDWQQRGVATALLEALVGRAREAGIERFVALVLSDNSDAFEVFEHLAPEGGLRRRSASGYTELVIELPDPEAVSDSLLGRALHAAARGALVANPWRVLRDRIAR